MGRGVCRGRGTAVLEAAGQVRVVCAVYRLRTDSCLPRGERRSQRGRGAETDYHSSTRLNGDTEEKAEAEARPLSSSKCWVPFSPHGSLPLWLVVVVRYVWAPPVCLCVCLFSSLLLFAVCQSMDMDGVSALSPLYTAPFESLNVVCNARSLCAPSLRLSRAVVCHQPPTSAVTGCLSHLPSLSSSPPPWSHTTPVSLSLCGLRPSHPPPQASLPLTTGCS